MRSLGKTANIPGPAKGSNPRRSLIFRPPRLVSKSLSGGWASDKLTSAPMNTSAGSMAALEKTEQNAMEFYS